MNLGDCISVTVQEFEDDKPEVITGNVTAIFANKMIISQGEKLNTVHYTWINNLKIIRAAQSDAGIKQVFIRTGKTESQFAQTTRGI